MSHAWHDVSGGVCEADDGYRTDVSGEAEDADEMYGVKSQGLGGVSDEATSY